MEEHENKKRTW